MLFSAYPLSSLILIAGLALLANLLLGGMPAAMLHPLAWWRSVLEWLSGKLNRFRRNDATRKRRGVYLALLVVAVAAIAGLYMPSLFAWPEGEWLEVAVLALFFSARQPFDAARQLRKLLAKSPAQIDAALLPVALLRRQQPQYDHATVLRAGVEMLALALAEGVIAPLFYYLLAGWPGVLLVRMVSVADDLLGYRNSAYQHFGTAIARLHTLLQWLPARLAALLLCMAAWFSPRCAPLQALKVMLAQASQTASANAGWPLAAMAGALKVTLAGPRALHGSYIADAWIGEGSSQLIPLVLNAALWLYAIALLLLVMVSLLVVGLV